jgi:hypothetical protein
MIEYLNNDNKITDMKSIKNFPEQVYENQKKKKDKTREKSARIVSL